MKTKVLVLGGGMVGSVMAADLANQLDFEVTVADIRESSLLLCKERASKQGRSVHGLKLDLADTRAVHQAAKDYGLVCGAMASGIAYAAMEAVIAAGRNYADISFMPEDADRADALAKKHGVMVVTDFGVAPGMSHVLAARSAAMLDRCVELEIYVGGLPRERRWPFQYKAGFSPADVIEEYTRPSRIVDRGQVVMKEALSEPELLDFQGVGSLEAFNTDGLRSLARTYLAKVPSMKEKTLRYPGHIELMRVLRHIGLMGTDPVAVKGTSIVPRDLLAQLMFPQWTYQPGEEDLTVMRIVGIGSLQNKQTRVQWDLFDLFNRETDATSMSRTTAFPCAAAARMLADGFLKAQRFSPGVINPEFLGTKPAVVERLLAEQQQRGITYRCAVSSA